MSKKNYLTVLSLHRISEIYDYFFDPIRPKIFLKVLEYCCKHYSVISFKDILIETSKPKLILSFDDGYYDIIEIALPLLRKMGLPCNLNLVNSCLNGNKVIWTQQLNDIFNYFKDKSIINDSVVNEFGITFKNNWIIYYISFFQKLLRLDVADRDMIIKRLIKKYGINSRYRMLNWDDAKVCIERFDVEIGCHTYNHESLITFVEAKDLDIEIGNSLCEIEKKLCVKVNILSLPNGQYNENVIEYSKEHGIKYMLLADGNVTPQTKINNEFNFISRIGMVNENIYEAIHRIELFHLKVKKII